MITSLIVFALSGLFVAYMFWNKKGVADEYSDQLAVDGSTTLGGASICSTDLDIRLRTMYQKTVAQIREIDGKYIKEKLHKVAECVERKGLNLLSRFLNRFGKVRDIVTGKDLPKNKGSVSFFLKHMVHHKSKLDAYLPDTLEEGGNGVTFKTLDPRLQKKLEINKN